jgi:hypothetical protein
MKDFLDELDMEVRSIKSDSSASEEKKESKHLTHEIQERDEKAFKNTPSREESGQKKARPTHPQNKRQSGKKPQHQNRGNKTQ